MKGLGALGRVHLVPVRHHSPRSSAVLSAILDEVRPKRVLVEGPEDATDLIEALVDTGTLPPVAILGYRTDKTPGSSVWPFASYSPEYVALRWAKEHGATSAFIDIPIGRSLALDGRAGRELAPSEDEPEGFSEACARARGHRSFEEFWEASFEAPAHDPEAFRTLLLAYADVVRDVGASSIHRARDAFMARRIDEHVREEGDAATVVVVVGAAHAAAFAAGDVDRALAAKLPKPVPCARTLVPFSFPRLSEQLGYGAGNRAPLFHQKAHDAGCSYRRATLEVLLELGRHLRLRGFVASLADVLEAYRLAMRLAEMREKADPGLDEVREAAIATLCRGEATHVDGFLWPTVVGRHVGRVAERVGKNALEEEFWRTVREKKLPDTDELVPFSIRLTNRVEVETSIFLHRLRVAGVPYASYVGTERTSARAVDDVGGSSALRRSRETWEAQWTPSTDLALVEGIVRGSSLAAVTARLLEERLAEAKSTGDTAEALLEAVVTATPAAVATALVACDRFAAEDDDLASLAAAARALSGLVSFGSSRGLVEGGDGAVLALLRKTFDRAVVRAFGASFGTDEATLPVLVALRTLHDIALSQKEVDGNAWFVAVRQIGASYAVNPKAAGLAAGLLYLAQELSEEGMAEAVSQRLSNALDPLAAAGFLEGFLEVNALALVKNRPVVAALDAFLTGIEKERFADALPVLRRAFTALGATERRYLLSNLIGLRRGSERAREATALLLEGDREKLRAIDDIEDLF